MEKIVIHPLYIRCKKVIESCKTKEQIEMTENYIDLSLRKMLRNLDYFKSLDAEFYFGLLDKDVKRKLYDI